MGTSYDGDTVLAVLQVLGISWRFLDFRPPPQNPNPPTLSLIGEDCPGLIIHSKRRGHWFCLRKLFDRWSGLLPPDVSAHLPFSLSGISLTAQRKALFCFPPPMPCLLGFSRISTRPIW